MFRAAVWIAGIAELLPGQLVDPAVQLSRDPVELPLVVFNVQQSSVHAVELLIYSLESLVNLSKPLVHFSKALVHVLL